MFILCSFLPSEGWYFHENGRCRCSPFSYVRVPLEEDDNIAGMEVVLFGSFVETTSAVLTSLFQPRFIGSEASGI